MGGAGGRDLAVITGILIEKSQLLKGQATAIVTTNEDRKSMDEMFQALVREGKRRGLTIDGDYEVVVDPPAAASVLPRPSSGNAA